jgi:hypothetical protein
MPRVVEKQAVSVIYADLTGPCHAKRGESQHSEQAGSRAQ